MNPKSGKTKSLKGKIVELSKILFPLLLIGFFAAVLASAYSSSRGIRTYESTGLDGTLINASVAIFGISIILYTFLTSGVSVIKERGIDIIKKLSKIGDMEEKLKAAEVSDEYKVNVKELFKTSSRFSFLAVGLSLASIIAGIGSEVTNDTFPVSQLIKIQIATFILSLGALLVTVWVGYVVFDLALEM